MRVNRKKAPAVPATGSLRGTNDPAKIAPKSNGLNGHAQALEQTAADLGTTPFWLRRRLEQYGLDLDALNDREALLRIFKERRDEIRRAAGALRDRLSSEQRLMAPTSSRFGAAARLEIARRSDPDLRLRPGERQTQNPRLPQRPRPRPPMRAWSADGEG